MVRTEREKVKRERLSGVGGREREEEANETQTKW
jgi:hypothetical protein